MLQLSLCVVLQLSLSQVCLMLLLILLCHEFLMLLLLLLLLFSFAQLACDARSHIVHDVDDACLLMKPSRILLLPPEPHCAAIPSPLQTQQSVTQLIAHDKEVYDIAFAQGTNVFASVGADGSVRMFDRRFWSPSPLEKYGLEVVGGPR